MIEINILSLIFCAICALVGYLAAIKHYEKLISTHYVGKGEIQQYCQWMSRDFPVFVDSDQYLRWKDECLQNVNTRDALSVHREKMKVKHLLKLKPPKED